MRIRPFLIEQYYARHEHSARHLLSSTDCESMAMDELVSWADDELRGLWDDLRLGYTDPQGHPLLRRGVAGLHPGVEPGDVCVLVPEEAVFVAVNTLVAPGDRVVCTYPAFQSLWAVAEAIGAEVRYWTPDESPEWRFDPDALARLVDERTSAVIVNFPHNPTAALPSRADYERVFAIARDCGARVFSDETFRGLEHDPGDRLPSAVEIDDRALSLFSLSKTHGLPGLRIAALLSRDEKLVRDVQELKYYTTICNSAPSELLATVAVRHHERILARNRKRIALNRDALARFMSEHRATFSWSPPRAAGFCFPRLLTGESSSRFAGRALEERGIMIAPSAVFPWDDDHIRIGLGRDDLPHVLDVLDDWLRAGGGRDA